MRFLKTFGLVFIVAACASDSPSEPVTPPPPPPTPLVTVFEGTFDGATNAQVEAACKATALPDANNSYYLIKQFDRITTRTFSDPWPGRANGDVHARQSATKSKPRFSCTQKLRAGTTAGEFNVEVGQEEGPTITVDVKVCEPDGAGGSRRTAINTGQLECPYAFGNIFPPHADYFNAGPYTTVEALEGPRCTIHRPTVLGEGNRRHPILLWANGITLSPTSYRGLLRHLASHGFVVAAADTSRVGSAGNGQNLLGCLQYLETQATTAGSVYLDKLNVYRVGAVGHSAGGGGVIMAGRDPRITATAPVQPWLGPQHGFDGALAVQQNGPMLLMSGELDTEIPFAHPQGMYTAITTKPIFWAHRIGSGHNEPLNDAANYRRPLTAWFRVHLMYDVGAASLFYGANCVLCAVPTTWVVQRKNGF